MNVFNYLIRIQTFYSAFFSYFQSWGLHSAVLFPRTRIQFSSTYVHTKATSIIWWSTESSWNSLFLQKHLISFYLCKSLTELLTVPTNFWVSEYICAAKNKTKHLHESKPKGCVLMWDSSSFWSVSALQPESYNLFLHFPSQCNMLGVCLNTTEGKVLWSHCALRFTQWNRCCSIYSSVSPLWSGH